MASTFQPPLTFAMIGGGSGAFIGAVHRTAAQLDGQARLVAGAFSSTPERSLQSGADLGLDPSRVYPTWRALIDAERTRSGPDRLDFVVIVTPNHAHFEPALALIEAGFNVVVDKPMVLTSAQAQSLATASARAGTVFAVTYNYTGYPMVRHARELVRSGELGEIRKVVATYHQGWLANPIEREGQKQAAWRTDPSLAGAGALGDIGSHAENLVSFVTGLEIESLAADVSSLVPGRRVDDDAGVLLRFAGGARGLISVSQVCIGEENNLKLRVYGTKASLSWAQEHPNHLTLMRDGQPPQTITRGGPQTSAAAAGATRLPPGHPEGFFEAFANIYRGVISEIRARRASAVTAVAGAKATAPGQDSAAAHGTFPTVQDGARGVRFIEACQRSATNASAWTPLGG
jgi:predicted dehydrogenase